MTHNPHVQHFFDEPTNTLSYVVCDPATRRCAIVDSVLNLDYASGTISFEGADAIANYVRSCNLAVDWLLETHVHADHLSAAPYLQRELGGRIVIGAQITDVQSVFGEIFAAGTGFQRDGSQFDVLLADGDTLEIGQLTVTALHTPGHTPACMAYHVGDALFVGDTLFTPDYGTARCDFPGGDAATLYRSVRRLLSLPRETRVFLCHDYPPEDRPIQWQSSIGEQRDHNIHIHDGVSEEAFVAMRKARDATLPMPQLILPSLQVNMRAGHLPPTDDQGHIAFTIPLNAFGGADLAQLAADE